MPELRINYSIGADIEGLLIDSDLVTRIAGSMTSAEVVSAHQNLLKVQLIAELLILGDSLSDAVAYIDAHTSEIH